MGPCPFRHGYQVSVLAPADGVYALQWGHALSGMDTAHSTVDDHLVDTASMGPCPFRHGYDSLITGNLKQLRGFNGAMPFQAWIQVSVLAPPDGIDMLQWGHALSGMDTRRNSEPSRHPDTRFNGAMPFQAWIRHSMRDFTPLSHAYSHFCSSTHYPTFFCC